MIHMHNINKTGMIMWLFRLTDWLNLFLTLWTCWPNRDLVPIKCFEKLCWDVVWVFSLGNSWCSNNGPRTAGSELGLGGGNLYRFIVNCSLSQMKQRRTKAYSIISSRPVDLVVPDKLVKFNKLNKFGYIFLKTTWYFTQNLVCLTYSLSGTTTRNFFDKCIYTF